MPPRLSGILDVITLFTGILSEIWRISLVLLHFYNLSHRSSCDFQYIYNFQSNTRMMHAGLFRWLTHNSNSVLNRLNFNRLNRLHFRRCFIYVLVYREFTCKTGNKFTIWALKQRCIILIRIIASDILGTQ